MHEQNNVFIPRPTQGRIQPNDELGAVAGNLKEWKKAISITHEREKPEEKMRNWLQ